MLDTQASELRLTQRLIRGSHKCAFVHILKLLQAFYGVRGRERLNHDYRLSANCIWRRKNRFSWKSRKRDVFIEVRRA
jgi:hypothetical protein